jgi:hypothetical protein
MLHKEAITNFFSSRNTAMIAGAILVVIAAFNWTIAPQTSQVSASERLLFVRSELEKKYKIVQTNLVIRKKRLNLLQKAFEENNDSARLFRPVEAKEFLGDIQSMAEACGCTVEYLQFGASARAKKEDAAKTEGYVSLRQTSMTLLGTYNNLVTLINRFQERLRQVWVHALSVESLQGSSEQLRCQLVLTIGVVNSDEEELIETPPVSP